MHACVRVCVRVCVCDYTHFHVSPCYTSLGSMPPNSTHLCEEGMQAKTFKLVRDGHFCEQEVTDLLMEPGKIPGCSGTRNLHDNLSDLRAQVAANQKV